MSIENAFHPEHGLKKAEGLAFLPILDHEILKTRLKKEFGRLGVTDEKMCDTLTTELNYLAGFFIVAAAADPDGNWQKN